MQQHAQYGAAALSPTQPTSQGGHPGAVLPISIELMLLLVHVCLQWWLVIAAPPSSPTPCSTHTCFSSGVTSFVTVLPPSFVRSFATPHSICAAVTNTIACATCPLTAQDSCQPNSMPRPASCRERPAWAGCEDDGGGGRGGKRLGGWMGVWVSGDRVGGWPTQGHRTTAPVPGLVIPHLYPTCSVPSRPASTVQHSTVQDSQKGAECHPWHLPARIGS